LKEESLYLPSKPGDLMSHEAAIAIVGTFDSKKEEHLFVKRAVEARGFQSMTIHVGTKAPSPFQADFDLYLEVLGNRKEGHTERDKAIEAVIARARELMVHLFTKGRVRGIISCGGGTGTHLGTSVMRVLPLGVPKVMLSTVASRDMAGTVGTKDITMMHSVVDLLGVNSISAGVLDRAAAAVCGMADSRWRPGKEKPRIAMTLFGFITEAAENIRKALDKANYEVIPFHANGTGGMAMEELAGEGIFDGILDLATHELADALKGGYCGGIGPGRLEPVRGKEIPRLVVPGGLDCAVLEFTRDSIPQEFRERKIFFYDFRSAVRLSPEETRRLASQVAGKMNRHGSEVRILIPWAGWSEADREGAPLFSPELSAAFVEELREKLHPGIRIEESPHHINDPPFADLAVQLMDEMVRRSTAKVTSPE
jgi:uncharacterized protein (UPF0261 family)